MRWLIIIVLGLAGAVAPASAGPADASDKLGVVVSILPQAYFVERIGGERVSVEVLVGENQNPHLYQATPRQMVRVGQATMYFTIGVEFERAVVPRIRKTFPKLKLIDTQAGVPLRRSECSHEHDHDHHNCGHGHHGHDHDHDRKHGKPPQADSPPAVSENPDPHIWLSPKLVKIQAKTICDALCEADPGHADEYRRNLAAFHADLDRAHDEIAKSLAPLVGQKVYVYHPAFGYFLDEFGLKQVPVEIEGKRPGPKQLVRLVNQAEKDGVRVIFVQAQFSQNSAAMVAEAIGGVVVAIDPLARDYLENLKRIAAAVREGLKKR